MALRAVPNNPLQRFVEEYKRIPAKKFPGKRWFPLVQQRFADSAEIPFVSLRSALQVVPESSNESRQPPSRMLAGNFIALEQTADKPPFQ
jgi:hypothetical protein